MPKVRGKDKLSGYHDLISIISTHKNDLDMLELEEFKELTSKLAQEGDDILCALRKASLFFSFIIHMCIQDLVHFSTLPPPRPLPPTLLPPSPPHPLNTQQKLFCPYF
jgi:hypothetical protein